MIIMISVICKSEYSMSTCMIQSANVIHEHVQCQWTSSCCVIKALSRTCLGYSSRHVRKEWATISQPNETVS